MIFGVSVPFQLVPIVNGSGSSSSSVVVVIALVINVMLLSGLIASYLFRYYRARAILFNQLNSFSLHKAECFAESDRTLITKMLTMWHSRDEQDSTAAIAIFDTFVRTKMHAIVQSQISEPIPFVKTCCDVWQFLHAHTCDH